jgi:hypothetical protein
MADCIYNDYETTVRNWLYNYNTLIHVRDSLKSDLQDQHDYLEMCREAAPIARYDGMPRGGSGQLTAVEGAAAEVIRTENEIKKLEQELKIVTLQVKRIDSALNALRPEIKALLINRYVERKHWYECGEEYRHNDKKARRTASKAVKELATYLFGIRAKEGLKQRFVFLQ